MNTSNIIRRPARYISAAIPYVNAPPHIGFALELIQADCLARFSDIAGYDVHFQTGCDENSLKNVMAAETAGVPTAQFVARNARQFARLNDMLNIRADGFIRTSTDARHRLGVEKLWRAAEARGDIYKKTYAGLYCVGCEQFYKPDDLVNGLCPEHRTEPDEVEEENYFFRLSRYQEVLFERITSGELDVQPQSRRHEVLRWLEDGLDDFSISRSSQRAHGWGLSAPGDPSQVVYVWFDALANYITALDYDMEGPLYARYWDGADQRTHVIGKGITRFHALYWPAMLLAAGLPLPDRILVHGYVTVEGQKIGKSAGNAVDPIPVASEFGADAVRYYLLRHIRTTEDGDFRHDRLAHAYHTDLAGQYGNLVHRILSLIERFAGGVVPERPQHALPTKLGAAALHLPDTVAGHVASFAIHDALSEIWNVIAEANRYVTATEPWSLVKRIATSGNANDKQVMQSELDLCLHELAVALEAIALTCWPFMPTTSEKVLTQLGLTSVKERRPLAGRHVHTGDMLFPR